MRAGQALNDLRKERNHADYDERPPLTVGHASTLVQTAEHLVQALDLARSEPVRSAITNAMKTYERDVLQDVTWQVLIV